MRSFAFVRKLDIEQRNALEHGTIDNAQDKDDHFEGQRNWAMVFEHSWWASMVLVGVSCNFLDFQNADEE